MKMLLLFIIAFFTTTMVLAQDTIEKDTNDSRQEIDLLLRGFDSFGFAYRIGNDASLWRIGLNFGANTYKSDNISDSSEYINSSSFFDISLGWEKRFEVVDKLFLRIGGDVFYQNSTLLSEFNQNVTIDQTVSDTRVNGYGVRLVLGTMYQINPNIHFGFEVLPQFGYRKSTVDRTDTANSSNEFKTQSSSTGFSLNTSSVRLNFGFNF